MPACVESSTVAMCADDAKCFKKVRNRKEIENLQIDIDNPNNFNYTLNGMLL